MPDSIFVEGGILVPGDALEMRAIKSSGPGGQNVNKVATKVELRVDLQRIRGMDPACMKRLLHLVAKRLDSSGRLLVTSQRSRDQFRNLEDARRKVHDWIAKALNPPRQRIASQPREAIKEQRLREKHIRAMRKQDRRSVTDLDED
jgi:ribosome-associated protein